MQTYLDYLLWHFKSVTTCSLLFLFLIRHLFLYKMAYHMSGSISHWGRCKCLKLWSIFALWFYANLLWHFKRVTTTSTYSLFAIFFHYKMSYHVSCSTSRRGCYSRLKFTFYICVIIQYLVVKMVSDTICRLLGIAFSKIFYLK